MQFMIDSTQETPHTLRLAAQHLLDLAAYIEAAQADAQNLPPVPVVTAPPVVAAVPTGTPSTEVPPPPSNIIPFVPPAPSATSSVPAPPAAPVASSAAAPAAATSTPAVVAGGYEFDKAGMPWDARIHQDGKAQKKDGTWKLKKKIDPKIVAEVTQELAARRLPASVSTPATVGASTAPVSLPQTQTQAPAVVPPPPQDEAEKVRQENERRAAEYQASQAAGQTAQAPGTVPPPPAVVPSAHAQEQAAQTSVSLPPSVPVPPAASVGVPDPAVTGVVQPITDFRALIAKISKLRGDGKLSADDIAGIVQQAGAPSMQLLGSMLHLVPVVDSLIDAVLLTKA